MEQFGFVFNFSKTFKDILEHPKTKTNKLRSRNSKIQNKKNKKNESNFSKIQNVFENYTQMIQHFHIFK